MLPMSSQISSLPESLSARPRAPVLTNRHLNHPVSEALLQDPTLQVASGVVDQKWQESSHFLLKTGSLLSQPRAQRAECGENERVAIAARLHLEYHELRSHLLAGPTLRHNKNNLVHNK